MAYRLLTGAAICALLAAGPALADDYRRGGRHDDWNWNRGGWDRYDDHRGGRHHDRHDDSGEDAALLIGGAIVGFALGSLLDDDGPSHSGTYYQSPNYSGSYNYNYGYAGDYGYTTPNYGSNYGYGYDSGYGYGQPSGGVTYVNDTSYGYGAGCQEVRQGRRASGAVIGGVIGGLMGNGVAADGVRGEGTAVGAVLGSVIGGSIGSSSADCNVAPPATVYQTGYPQADPYYGGPQGYPSAPPQDSYRWPDDELYGGPDYRDGYNGPAAQECQQVMRVTKLPDGREIHEPVEVCREAYYGEWSTAR